SLLASSLSNFSPMVSDHIVLIATIAVSALTATAAVLHVQSGHRSAPHILIGSIGVLLPSMILLLSQGEYLPTLLWNNLINFSLALQAIVYAGSLSLGFYAKKQTTDITSADNQAQQSFQLHSHSLAGEWYWNMQTNDYHLSENVYKILPLTFSGTENAINKVFTQIDPGGKTRLRKAFLKAQSEGIGFQSDFKLSNEKKSSRHFLVNAEFQKNPLNENTSTLIGTLHDITDYKDLDHPDNEHEIRWREIADSTFESILIFQDKRIIDANSACEHLFGYTPLQLIGTTGSTLFSATQLSSLPLNSSNDHEYVGEFTLKHFDGNDIYVEVRTKSRKFQERSIQTLAIRDVSQHKKQEEQLRKLGHTDNLTGLYNRALFQDHLQLAIDKAQRIPQKHALLYIDLDQFKHVNDSLGHDVGDELLKEVGRRLTKKVRKIDTVARLGGDEFALLIEDIIAPYNAAKIADSIIEAMYDEIIIDDYRLQVSPSIGIAIFPTDGTNGGELLRKADTAMYHAKDQGRNNYQFYTEELHVKIVRRMNLESELRVAIERGELFLNYQPQVSLETGAIIGAEALLRWNSSKYGMVSPGEFISIAEENGLIWSIGEFVLKQACKQAVPWITEHPSFDHIAVNISGIQFNNSDLVDTIKRVLEESNLPAQHLELEITEGAIIDNADDAIKIMKQLKELGVKLSLDDFGTGYSSLSYLRKFPVDCLKIDRSFVLEIVTDKSGLIIAENIVNLAHALNLNVVAEGVETTEQLSIIRNMGCDELQGYIFSRPLDADDLSSALAKEDNLYTLIEELQ
ncbi:MAG: diguanylate cyclase (GGDEF)-like protein/PAS domain S-box-containing protein, partial [Oceanicoccus sp.]